MGEVAALSAQAAPYNTSTHGHAAGLLLVSYTPSPPFPVPHTMLGTLLMCLPLDTISWQHPITLPSPPHTTGLPADECGCHLL